MMSSTADAWRAFVRGDVVPAGAVEPVILASWERSRQAGVAHDPPAQFVAIPPDDLARRLAANAELLEVAKPHLAWISDWIGAVPHVVYVVDAEGVVLASHGTDPAMMNDCGLTPGHDWAERVMGTNGAGTALAANRPVAVVGPEHYARAWHGAT